MRLLLALTLLLGCLSLTSAIIIERGMESLEDDGWIFDDDEDGSDSLFSREVSYGDDLNDKGEDEEDRNSDHIFISDEADEESAGSNSEDSSSESSESSESDESDENWKEGDRFRKTDVDLVKERMANMSQAMSTLLNQTYHKMLKLPPPSSAGNQRTQLVVDFLDDLKKTFGDDEHIQPHLELMPGGHRHRGHGRRHHGHRPPGRGHKYHGHGHRPHGHGHRPHGHGHRPHGHGHRPHGHGHRPHGHGHRPHGHGHRPHGHDHKHHGHGHNHHGHGRRPQGSQGNRGKFDISRFNMQKGLSKMATRNKRSAMRGGFQRMGGGQIQGKESFQVGGFKRFPSGKLAVQNGFGEVHKIRPTRNGKFGNSFKGKSRGQDGLGKGHKQPRSGKRKFAQGFNGKRSGKGFQKQPYGQRNHVKSHQRQQLNTQKSPIVALLTLLKTKADAISTLINDSCSALQSLPAADNNEHSKASLQRKMFVVAFLGKYMAILKNSTDYKEESSEEEQGEEQWCIAKTEAMIQLINTTNQRLHMMRTQWDKYFIIGEAHMKGTMISKSFLCHGYFRIVNVTEPVLRLVNHTYQKMLKLSSADEDGKTLLFLDFVMELEDTLDFRNLTRQIHQELYERHMKRLEKLGFKNPKGNQRHSWKKGQNHGKGGMAKHGGKFGRGLGKWQRGKNGGKGKWDHNKQQPWKPRYEGKVPNTRLPGGFRGGQRRPRKNGNHGYKGGKENKGHWMTNTDKTKKKPARQINWTNRNTNAWSGKKRRGPTMVD